LQSSQKNRLGRPWEDKIPPGKDLTIGEIKRIAKSILTAKGIEPTTEIIEKVIAMPGIRGLALDQLRQYNDLLRRSGEDVKKILSKHALK
jgi:hypothetical protein